MNITTLSVGLLDTNCYLVVCPETLETAVIDPGAEGARILAAIRSAGAPVSTPAPGTKSRGPRAPSLGRGKVRWIINTHGHADHVAANAALKAAFPDARLAVHEADAQMLVDAGLNLSAAFGMPVTSPPADVLLHDGDKISFGSIRLEVLHVPGHTQGGIALYTGESRPSSGPVLPGPAVLFSGDALFQGGIGRSDFPGGSGIQLIQSIRSRLLTLPADTEVLPGHGGPTTIGQEARSNPFLT